MNENAREIDVYLPKDPGVERLYIKHLRGAFEALMEKEDHIRSFGVLPFHLSFMFAVQYKVYRLSAYKKIEYLKTLKECKHYPTPDKLTLENNPPVPNDAGIIPRDCSVRNLSLIKEGDLFDFLNIIKVDSGVIEKGKELVRKRNHYAHANGKIVEEIEALEDIEELIDEYLSVLKGIQDKFTPINDTVASEWLQEVSGEEELKEFVEARLFKNYVCPADFWSGTLTLFSLDEDLPFEECQATVSKVLTLGSPQGLIWLQHIAMMHPDSGWRLKVIQMLDEAGKLNADFKAALLQNEKDPETTKLLRNLGIH